MEKRYRQWAGNSKGDPENKEYCYEEVPDGGRSVLSHQCQRKRGYGKEGLYCKQHAKRHPAEQSLATDLPIAGDNHQ